MSEKIELKETKNGFSLRDLHSKAILNSNTELLLKYKIQKTRFQNINAKSAEFESVKSEVQELRNEITEIKKLLLQIVGKDG